MVANKIKSTTTPVGFHGHIRHQSLMSRVSGAILSAGLLWSLPHTPQQNRPLHQYFTGRALTGHEVVILPKGKKISSSSNTAGGLFNSAPQSMSSKRVKPVSGLFFFSGEWEKIVLTLESPLFLFITGVRGPVIFIGHTADILISAVHFWLWCQPLQFSSQKKRLWHVRVVCAIFTVIPSLYLNSLSWETTLSVRD